MYFANPLGLLGLLALPAIVGLHLFRRKFPPLYVAGTHLWGVESRVAEAGRRRDRLPVTASLLLELLAALLLTLALSDPRFDASEAAAHLVVVLDDSASMQAAPAGSRPYYEQAATEIRQRMTALGREARLSLILTGRHPTLVGTRGMRWDEAARNLAAWRPSAPGHSFEPAWDEAVQLVGRNGRFLFLTDHLPPRDVRLPEGMELLALGEPLPNVAVSAARWTPGEPGREGSLFVRLTNLGGVDAAVRMVGRHGEQEVFSQRLSLAARSELPIELPVPNGLARLTVRADVEGDPLPLDNEATLIEPQPRIVGVAVDLPADSPEFALVRKTLDVLPGVVWVEPDGAALLIGDATRLPPSRRELWWFGLGPLNRSEAVRAQAVDVVGPYLIERQHPLLDGVTLGGIVWGGIQSTALRLSPLISADHTVLLGRLEGTESTAWVMNIDLARSNLSESPDWPLLIANLVELRRDALPGLRRWNYRLGEAVIFRAPPLSTDGQSRGAELQLRHPDGRLRQLLRDRRDFVDVPPLEQPGVYQLLEGGRPLGEFAVNFFDSEESNLSMLGRAHLEPPTLYEPARISLDNPFSWLIILAVLLILAALLLDWYVIGRRSPVARFAAES